MKKTIIATVIILMLITSYVVVINSTIKQNKTTQNGAIEQDTEEMHEQMSMSDSVKTVVTKKRWYGIIIKNSSQSGNLDNLYLFKIIKLPTNRNGFSFIWMHFLVITTLLILFIVVLIWDIISKKEGKETCEQYGKYPYQY